jgi:cellulose synthase/poly-beta-1,6-N-acetylglucosamine synthase-like glycosyltransferase
VEAVGAILAGLLVAFTARRCVLIVASALRPRRTSTGHAPPVVVALAARDEETRVPPLLDTFARLEYPADRLSFVLVDDGSRDGTGAVLSAWASSRPNARCVTNAESIGKAGSLNRAMGLAPAAEIVVVYDADLRPHPDALAILASAFADPRIGAASGYRRPLNAMRTPIAAYASLEAWVHQLVTQAGKDRCGWNPTTMGGHCAYRRAALDEVGGFPTRALGEDIEVSLGMVAAGWRTRFLAGALADGLVVESLARYWNQRTRWTRVLYASSKKASRLEGWMVAAGYSDRIVFLLSIAFVLAGWMSAPWLLLYLVPPVLAIASALARADAGARFAAYLALWIVPLFALDVCVTLVASVNGLRRKRVAWPTGAERRAA